MKEGKSNKIIQDWLVSIGAYVFKTVASNRAGVHDIIFCLAGRFGTIEGKTKIGKASTLQAVHLRAVQKAGGFAMIAKSVAEAKLGVTQWINSGYTQQYDSNIKDLEKFTL